MFELKEYNNKKYASAKQLHEELGIKKKFAQWVKYNISRCDLTDNDFVTILLQSTGGRPTTDYLLTKEDAIGFIMVSGGEKANEVRKLVIKAFEEKQTGVLLNVDQVAALTDMVKAMTLVSVQKKAEKQHFLFKEFRKHSDWWKYRSDLLGYSVESLKIALAKIGKKYSSQKKALIHLDPAEIIRTGVVDLLIALGRNEEYALNVGEFAKVIAEKNGYHVQIWDDTKPNPLGLKLNEIIERQKIGNKYLK